LFNKPVNTKYDKNLFSARRAITLGGFFDLLVEKISDIVSNESFGTPFNIVDCGCGEGSLFSKIAGNFSGLNAVGIDISKDGIKIAAANNKNICWIVSDLANIPLKDKSANVILNILSPANYSEFKRCVKDGGLILKVVPEACYLQEIRKTLNKPQNGEENVKKLFYKNFKNVEETRITETIKISPEQKKDFLLMTPLSWSAAENKSTDFGNELTLDLTILQAWTHSSTTNA
jgi:23S rRNA (guanine745-N1)-methyltransferase